jgi:hypothetical protein
MKSLNPPNLLSRSLIGAVGLGVALLGLPQSAKAFTVNRGTDYLVTPTNGANIYFADLGRFVSFGGLAIGTPTATPPDGGFLGKADTVVNRLDDVLAPYLPTLPVADLIDDRLPANNVTSIQIVGLSLQGTGGDAGKVFVGLDPAKVSGGKMAIAHNETDDIGGIWTSYFGIHGVAVVANDGVTLTPTGNDYVRDLISNCGKSGLSYTCRSFSKGFGDFTQTIDLVGGSVGYEKDTGFSFKSSNQPWSHDPNLGQFQGANLVQPGLEQNFYLTQAAIHDAGDGTIHTVVSVPEPLTILGSLTAFGFGAAFKRKRDKKN